MTKPSRDYKEYLIESLKDADEAAAYLSAALEERNAPALLLALRDIAEARGISAVAARTGLNRVNLYRILSDQGNPRLSSLLALFEALGLRMIAEPIAHKTAEITSVGVETGAAGPYRGLDIVGGGGRLSTNEGGVATGLAA